jgi:DNA-binding transcriptional ArsR family regulator
LARSQSAGHGENALRRQFVAITKALACEKRRRILMALRNRELCEGVITEMLGLAPSITSRHIWLLRHAGLVGLEKAGRGVCYRLAAASPSTVAGQTLRWLGECRALHRQVVQDAARIQGLSGRSAVQAECRERRKRLTMRRREIAGRRPRKRGTMRPAG